MSDHHDRFQRLEQALHEPVTVWRVAPGVAALQALRGGQGTGAVPLGAAMGDLSRLESPRARLTFRGLLPSAYASGAHRRQGSITKAGNTQAHRVLVAGAGAYRSPATVSRHLPRRLEHQPTVIQDISGKAQVRLCQRSRRLGARGKQAHVVTVAMARERLQGASAKAQPRWGDPSAA